MSEAQIHSDKLLNGERKKTQPFQLPAHAVKLEKTTCWPRRRLKGPEVGRFLT